jgi:hypothetical protein
MQKILLLSLVFIFFASCGTKDSLKTLDLTGTRDILKESSGTLDIPTSSGSHSLPTSSSDVPVWVKSVTETLGSTSATGTVAPVVLEKTEQDMEEFVDTADAEIEALFEEMFQTDGNK